MTKITNGDALTTALLEADWTVADDGYGLLTGRAVFSLDGSVASTFTRGDAHPKLYNMKLHRISYVANKLDIKRYTAEYVGIDSNVNSGNRTNPQAAGGTSLVTEHIATHPNFFALAPGFSGSPIAGVGTGTITAPVYPLATGSATDYVGNNGATFDKGSGKSFAFRGFKDPQYYLFYGVTSYLAPTSCYSGFFYTTQTSDITSMQGNVGKTSGTNSFGSIKLLPDYIGTTFVNSGPPSRHQLLLGQVNYEDFGTLYKINYEVRYNYEGFPSEVYAPSA